MTSITEDAFWNLVDMTDEDDGCWLWTGALTRDGYGVCSPRATGSPRAHRAAYVLHNGEIPDGLDLDHLCRVRACVRPSHLEPVTRGENVKRGWEHRRRPGQEPGVHTPVRTFRVPQDRWDAVKTTAAANGETVTDVLNRALEDYVKGKGKKR